MVIHRGDIYYADLRPVVGSEQGGVRPVLIIQNDIGNKHSPTVICACDHEPDEQGKTSDACGVRFKPVCTGQRFCSAVRTASYH